MSGGPSFYLNSSLAATFPQAPRTNHGPLYMTFAVHRHFQIWRRENRGLHRLAHLLRRRARRGAGGRAQHPAAEVASDDAHRRECTTSFCPGGA